MSWLLFDEHGNRAQKVTLHIDSATATPGWTNDDIVAKTYNLLNAIGFIPERSWRPTYFAAKMAKGYRVFELDVGAHEYVDDKQIVDWWQPARHIAFGQVPPEQEKRLPTIAAVEMWVRHQAARDG